MTLRQAVAKSVNTVAVQMSEIYGRGNVIAIARSLGVTSPIESVPSLALGAYETTLMEMVAAYGHLASEGLGVQPYGITKITNKKGDVLYERKDQVPPRIISKQVVAKANDLFSAVINAGTGVRARIGRPAAGKTGTTSDYKDAWFIGYTPDLVTGVWVGNDAAISMKKVTGSNLPAAIWRGFMTKALAGKKVRALPIAKAKHSDTQLPWGSGWQVDSEGSEESGVGGRHLPWGTKNRGRRPAPAHNQEETKNFWEDLGL